MPKHNTVISFDLDDTLYDNTPVIQHAFDALYQFLVQHYPELQTSIPNLKAFIKSAYTSRMKYPDEVDFHRIRHLHIHDCLTAAGYDGADTAPAYDVFFQARQKVCFFPGVITTLQELSQSYRLVSISNGNADPGLIGLGDLLTEHFNPHMCGYAKPDPRIYEWACQQLKIAPAQLIHIGDCLDNDIKAAIQAGAQAIWFNPTEVPDKHQPRIRQIAELPGVIHQLL